MARPNTKDLKASKICIECGLSFSRGDFRPMVDDEWERRKWCSWECRVKTKERLHRSPCECCQEKSGGYCRGLCKDCYEALRIRSALEEPARSAWIQYLRVQAEIDQYNIPGVGRRPALRKKRENFPLTHREEMLLSLYRSFKELEGVGCSEVQPRLPRSRTKRSSRAE